MVTAVPSLLRFHGQARSIDLFKLRLLGLLGFKGLGLRAYGVWGLLGGLVSRVSKVGYGGL